MIWDGSDVEQIQAPGSESSDRPLLEFRCGLLTSETLEDNKDGFTSALLNLNTVQFGRSEVTSPLMPQVLLHSLNRLQGATHVVHISASRITKSIDEEIQHSLIIIIILSTVKKLLSCYYPEIASLVLRIAEPRARPEFLLQGSGVPWGSKRAAHHNGLWFVARQDRR